MEILIKASQFILSLSILIVLHELGHFIPAKLFGTRVESFYLFFNPKFSLFKKKIGETEYGIGWLPLGGYVKISGMIDESMDKEQMKKPAEPWEFRSKPAWQRLIIMLGGVTVNIILAFLIYIFVTFTWGRSYIKITDATYGMHTDSLLTSIGFQNGDIPVGINGEGLPERYTYGNLTKDALLGRVSSVTVKRDDEELEFKLPDEYGHLIISTGKQGLFLNRTPFIIDSVIVGNAAEKAGVKVGDKVVGVNDVSTPFYGDFFREIMKDKKKTEEDNGKDIILKVERSGELISLKMRTNEKSQIGVVSKSATEFFEVTKEEYSFLESIPEGFSETTTQLNDYVAQMPLLFSKAGLSQLGGFGSMGGMFSAKWHWQSFWSLTAMLSVILAFMNVLPIPALDGGHAMFLTYEIVFRRKPSDKFMEYAQMVGMGLLFTLLIYANGNDIYKLIFGG